MLRSLTTSIECTLSVQMSEGESEAMEAYEEEELETGAGGRKKMPSIDRLAREAIVNRWASITHTLSV